MKIKDYIKEKFYFILLSLIMSTISIMFLKVGKCNPQVIVIVVFFFWLVVISNLVVEYVRRRSYYTNILRVLDGLDQKYLLAEVIPEPLFQDGKILYEAMREVNKSMLDNINEYKIREAEYKDYIEMWVHEIKTPLAASKLILQNNKGVMQESVEEELDKVEGFVEQALFYARSTTLEKDYMIKQLSLKSVMNKVIRKHSKTFIYKKIKIEMDDLDKMVYCDSKWLEFIFDQIITNALKYTKEETGIIHIDTKQQNDCIQLYMKDNGIGIALGDVKRVFDKGFTGTNGRNSEKATGMGLYLCKLLCDKLYLDIQISSHVDVGTTICISFPTSAHMLLR